MKIKVYKHLSSQWSFSQHSILVFCPLFVSKCMKKLLFQYKALKQYITQVESNYYSLLQGNLVQQEHFVLRITQHLRFLRKFALTVMQHLPSVHRNPLDRLYKYNIPVPQFQTKGINAAFYNSFQSIFCYVLGLKLTQPLSSS